MSDLNRLKAYSTANGPQVDAFGRLRVAEPHTVFDSKQVFDNAPLFWDDAQLSGAGTTSVHSVDKAASTIGAPAFGARLRQTYMRFNYEPGKSQQVMMTGILAATGSGVGNTMEIGLADNNNGALFMDTAGVTNVVVRTSTSGAPTETRVPQSDWNIDPMDGSGVSGVVFDKTKAQIFLIDFSWLGVGRVRFGFVVDGRIHYCHQFVAANMDNKVYMSTPNLPLRYKVYNNGSGASATVVHICSTVISEGGTNATGQIRSAISGITAINANTIGVSYVALGIRLKSGREGCTVNIKNVTVINTANGDYAWSLVLNPTVAVAATFASQANSCVEIAPGNAGSPSTSTVTGGTVLDSGFAKGYTSSGGISSAIDNAIRLGVSIAGVADEIYLVVTPLAANAKVHGSVTWQELS